MNDPQEICSPIKNTLSKPPDIYGDLEFGQINSTIIDKNASSPLSIKLKIVQQNIQGINNKIERLEILLHIMDIDVMCLTEHWLNVTAIAPLHIMDYDLVGCYNREILTHGGVAIFIKSSFAHLAADLPLVNKMSSEKNFEAVGIELKDTNLIIVCIYRSPSGDFDSFVEACSRMLTYVSLRNKHLVICGDFNVNFLLPTHDVKILLDLFNTYKLTVTINSPTRITATSRTCIDNILTNLES